LADGYSIPHGKPHVNKELKMNKKSKSSTVQKVKMGKWSDEEIAIVKKAYEDGLSGDEIRKLLPHRSVLQIYNVARRHKLKKPRRDYAETTLTWSIPELDLLKSMFLDYKQISEIQKALAKSGWLRTESSIAAKAHSMNLRRNATVSRLLREATPEQKQVLVKQGEDAFLETVVGAKYDATLMKHYRVSERKRHMRAKLDKLIKVHKAEEMPRDVQIVFLKACGMSLAEVAEVHKLSRERVRQICKMMMTEEMVDE
jgi:hypothetical protein